MFRKLFFGLGVLLGVVSPQTAPDLSARVYRIGDQLYVNIELVGAYAGTALDLVSSGTRVAIGLEAAVEGSSWPPVRVTRSIRRDGAVDAWIVETETKGEEKILRDRDAALILASRAWGIHLGPADGSRRAFAVTVRAGAGLIDAEGLWHRADILWGYAEPELRFAFSGPEEVPF
ncbi:MAG: hypothetical protein A2413_01990 [Treponema sp. RIFOXYC1_FULL_61_9]|nr:MAG: hypothetical protein A2413_01990 [Treponema sp. RIFOXYC1_FULL_61_9]